MVGRAVARPRRCLIRAAAAAAAVVVTALGGGGGHSDGGGSGGGVATAHSSLISPIEATHVNACRVGGRGGFHGIHCPGPCPRGRLRDRLTVPVYRRGQVVKVSYLHNNHRGGFIRLSLVPWHRRFSGRRHRRNAFHHACWAAGTRPCRPAVEPCGTDSASPPRAHTHAVVIPAVFPDGDYALGWAWYGGSHRLGDYYSCARVRVAGGARLVEAAPVAVALGRGQSCVATVGRLGVCWREPCRRRMRWRARLDGWPRGRLPRVLRRDEVDA